MDEVQRHRVKRRGLKGSVTKLLTKVEDMLSAELETIHLDSTLESRRLLVSTTVAQLTAKMDQIKTLDEAIVATIQDKEELETKVCDADTYLTTLEERIVFLTEFIKRASQPPMTRPPTPRKITTESCESPKCDPA